MFNKTGERRLERVITLKSAGKTIVTTYDFEEGEGGSRVTKKQTVDGVTATKTFRKV